MGLFLYLFCAVAFILMVAWAVYVLPTPGTLSAWELAGAFLPALLMMLAVLAVLALISLPFYVVRLFRRVREYQIRSRRR